MTFSPLFSPPQKKKKSLFVKVLFSGNFHEFCNFNETLAEEKPYKNGEKIY